LGDISGAGKTDIFWDYEDGNGHTDGERKFWLTDESQSDLVTVITTGCKRCASPTLLRLTVFC